jgi:hypothetical protein
MWNKIVAVRKHLGESDWIFWCDVDTLICNQAFTLNQIARSIPDQSVAMSTDCNGWCAGVFLIRNCDWAKRFLDTILFLGDSHPPDRPKPLRDQATIKLIGHRFPGMGGQIADIAESVIANPLTPPLATAPFIEHYWSGTNSLDEIAGRMTAVLAKGWHPSGAV